MAVDDDLVLKSNQIVIPSDFQNHAIPLGHYAYLVIIKTKWLPPLPLPPPPKKDIFGHFQLSEEFKYLRIYSKSILVFILSS